MTVTNVPGVIGGRIYSQSTSYATARTGGTLNAIAATQVGQSFASPNYSCYEAFFEFNTSVIPDGDEITAVELWFYKAGTSTVHFDFEARLKDWGGGAVDTGDWVSGAGLAGLTLLASRNSNLAASNWYALTSQPAFITSIDKTGYTRILVNSSRHRNSNTPTTSSELLVFSNAANLPYLVITHESTGQTESGGAEFPLDITFEGAGEVGTPPPEFDGGAEFGLALAFEGQGYKQAFSPPTVELGLDLTFEGGGEGTGSPAITVYSTNPTNTNNGHLVDVHSTYANALDGIGASTSSQISAGQQRETSTGNQIVREGFVRFDTSAIPDLHQIDDLQLSLYSNFATFDSDFDVEVRVKSWGPTLEAGDWATPAVLETLPLVAKIASTDLVQGGRVIFENLPEFASLINKTGFTELVITTSRIRLQQPPTSTDPYETAGFQRAFGDPDEDPRLIVFHSPAPTGGADLDLTITLEGAGYKFQVSEGGADLDLVLGLEGEGRKVQISEGGSELPTTITFEGYAYKQTGGGAELVSYIAFEGGGIEVHKSGVEFPLVVTFEGAASKVTQGGSVFDLGIDLEGTGIKQGQGGSELPTVLTFEGGGERGDHPEGGAEFDLEITLEGGGERVIPVASGGAEFLTFINFEGEGLEMHKRGAEFPVVLSFDGAGWKQVSGGSEFPVAVTFEGVGFKVKEAEGGSEFGLRITFEGKGRGEANLGVWITFTGRGFNPYSVPMSVFLGSNNDKPGYAVDRVLSRIGR